MENVFDALCSALSEPKIKELFLASEGIDLMVLMMKYVSTGTEGVFQAYHNTQGKATISFTLDQNVGLCYVWSHRKCQL